MYQQQQQQMQPPMNHVRAKQVHELAQTYKGAVTLVNAADRQEFRVPLTLKASKTPLQVKIVLYQEFPNRGPIIQILAEVIHEHIDDKTFCYTGPMIKSWNTNGNVVALLQKMTKEFDEEPPIPKALFAEGAASRQTMTGRSGINYDDTGDRQVNDPRLNEFDPTA